MPNDQPCKPTLITPAPGYRGMTELHYAAYCNDADEVRAQLTKVVDVDARDDNGWTPLHWSIDMAQTCDEPERIVSLLLAAGASANSVDRTGLSVLLVACGRNNEAILEQLLQSGADIHLRTATGTTALHEAAGCNFVEGIRRLLRLGADPNAVDRWNRTPEQLAGQCGFQESVAVLKAARLK